MRMINKTIFLGNQFAGNSCYALHKRLEEGIEILGGLQQPSHSSSEQDVAINKAIDILDKAELKDIVLDIAAAFGYKIEIKGRNNE